MENTREAIERHKKLCNDTRSKLKTHEIDGPWMSEPDRVEFKYHGLDCLLVRNYHMFNWCGYVGVDLNHHNVKRLKQTKYKLGSTEHESWDDDGDNIEVHGGITYREECQGFICHITEENDKLFWFGFDCAHFQDFVPGMELNMRQIRKAEPERYAFNHGSVYRDMNFVQQETEKLAMQLASFA